MNNKLRLKKFSDNEHQNNFPLYGIIFNNEGLREENYLYTAAELKQFNKAAYEFLVEYPDEIFEDGFLASKTYIVYSLADETKVQDFLEGKQNDLERLDFDDEWEWKNMLDNDLFGTSSPTMRKYCEKLIFKEAKSEHDKFNDAALIQNFDTEKYIVGEHEHTGYKIIESVKANDNTEFVIGHNADAPDPYVCWYYDNINDNYFWGKYAKTIDEARNVMNERLESHNQKYITLKPSSYYISFKRFEKELELNQTTVQKEDISMDKLTINGIYHTKQYEDSWIVKIDDKYYSAPVKCIQPQDLKEIENIDDERLRPVGKNVERLLLFDSDIAVKDNELRAMDISRKEKIQIEPTSVSINKGGIEL